MTSNSRQWNVSPFYDEAKKEDCCLVIATGEQRVYANILLTIGVVDPPADQAV